MVNRIKEILRRYDLSSSRLADQLEVPRSTISHILSERNKPSLEFIQKVLERYPEIDTEWLVRGKGSIFGKEKDLFSEVETDSPGVKETKTTFPPENKINPAPIQVDPKKLNLTGESKTEEATKSFDNQRVRPINEGQKKIVKIITFYQNNTFDEYLPSKNDSQ